MLKKNNNSFDYELIITRHSHSINNAIPFYLFFNKLPDPFLTSWGLFATELLTYKNNINQQRKLNKQKINIICVSILLRTWLTAIISHLASTKKLILFICPYLKEKDIRYITGTFLASYIDIGNHNKPIIEQLYTICHSLKILINYATIFIDSQYIKNKYHNKEILIYYNDLYYFSIEIHNHTIICYQHKNNIKLLLLILDIYISKSDINKNNLIYINDIIYNSYQLIINTPNIITYHNLSNNIIKLDKNSKFNYFKNNMDNNIHQYIYYYHYEKNYNIEKFIKWLFILRDNIYFHSHNKTKSIYTYIEPLFKNKKIHIIAHNNIMHEFLNNITNNYCRYNDNNWSINIKVKHYNNTINIIKIYTMNGIPMPSKSLIKHNKEISLFNY